MSGSTCYRPFDEGFVNPMWICARISGNSAHRRAGSLQFQRVIVRQKAGNHFLSSPGRADELCDSTIQTSRITSPDIAGLLTYSILPSANNDNRLVTAIHLQDAFVLYHSRTKLAHEMSAVVSVAPEKRGRLMAVK